MQKTYPRWTLAWLCACGLVAGCGSSDSATVPTSGPVTTLPVTSISAPVQSKDLSGLWEGSFPNGADTIQLNLTQEGDALEGDGALFRGGQLTVCEVSGNVNPDGQCLLDLVPRDDDNEVDDAQLALSFSAQTAQGGFVDEENPNGLPITLSRPNSKVQLREDAAMKLWDHSLTALSRFDTPEVYRVEGTCNGERYVIEISLAGSTLWEFVGSWKIVEGGKINGTETSGRVAASNSVTGSDSHFTLKDSNSILDRGDVWFPRITRGTIGGSSTIISKNDSSRLYTSKSWQRLDGTVTLVSR